MSKHRGAWNAQRSRIVGERLSRRGQWFRKGSTCGTRFVAWSAPMGFLLFSIGNGLAIAGLVLAALGYADDAWAGWIVALVATGELTILASVLLLGDDGYQRLEARTSALLRRDAGTRTETVSASRHALGLALLIAHLATYFVVWIGGILSYTRATDEDPFPFVFGLGFEAQGPAFIWGVITAELLFAACDLRAGSPLVGSLQTSLSASGRNRPEPPEPEAPKPPSTLRYRLGLGVFIVGNALAVGGLILPALGLAKRPNGRCDRGDAGGRRDHQPQQHFSARQRGLQGAQGPACSPSSSEHRPVRRSPAVATESATSFLALHVVAQFAALVFPIASHYGALAEGPFPTVLGLERPEQLKWFVGLLISGEALFFAGVYTLGADWWGRFR